MGEIFSFMLVSFDNFLFVQASQRINDLRTVRQRTTKTEKSNLKLRIRKMMCQNMKDFYPKD